MTTNITILVQRLKVAAKNGCCHTLFPDDCLALVEALEKSQQRIAELENYAEAEAVGADRAAEDSVYWMKRCKELESRTVTVKLPTRIENIGLRSPLEVEDMWIAKVKGMLTAAGIKVEAE